VQSSTAGSTSTVAITAGPVLPLVFPLVSSLNPPTGGIIQTSVAGKNQGVQNNPVSPALERERMLTHIIFAPVLKAANRVLTITYTLTISVARSV
jgi:hypothetical protein